MYAQLMRTAGILGVVIAVVGAGSSACGSSQAGSGPDTGLAHGGADSAMEDASSPTPDAPSSGESGASDAGGVDGGTGTGCPLAPINPGDGGACNQLRPTGPLIQETCSDAAVPVAHGGTIADGTYFLETTTYYGTCPPPMLITQDRVTWIICGSQWESAQVIGTNSTNYDVMVSPGDAGASSLALNIVCPRPVTIPWTYDVTPGHVSFFFPNGTGTIEVDSYARQ
jgi:hypothetical protein